MENLTLHQIINNLQSLGFSEQYHFTERGWTRNGHLLALPSVILVYAWYDELTDERILVYGIQDQYGKGIGITN